MKLEEIKPCPFCGNKVIYIDILPVTGKSTATCGKCLAISPCFKRYGECLSWWNRRDMYEDPVINFMSLNSDLEHRLDHQSKIIFSQDKKLGDEIKAKNLAEIENIVLSRKLAEAREENEKLYSETLSITSFYTDLCDRLPKGSCEILGHGWHNVEGYIKRRQEAITISKLKEQEK